MNEKCVIASCASFTDDATCSFFEFSSKWAKYLNIPYDPSKKICHKHFPCEYIIEGSAGPFTKILEVEAVPIIDVEGPLVNKTNENFHKRIINSVELNYQLKKRFSELEKELNELNERSQQLDRRLVSKDVTMRKMNEKLEKSKQKTEVDKSDILTRCFSETQINYLLGRKRVVWTDDDMARAFCIRNMTNRECYLYLKKTLNIPLPALRSVQKWAASS